jgi:hypothetical protein
MKKYVIIITILLFCFFLHAQQASKDFYYYFGEKIFLTERTDKIFVKLSQNTDTQTLLSLIQADESLQLIMPDEKVVKSIAILQTTEGKNISVEALSRLREHLNVITAQFMLEYKKDNLLGLVDEFVVKLNPATEFRQLQDSIYKYDCVIVSEDQYVKNQYTLSISKDSELNAM